MNKRATLTILAVLVLAGFGTADLAQDDDQQVLVLGDVPFPHELHYDALELECESCHHETQATKLEIPHQEYFEDFRGGPGMGLRYLLPVGSLRLDVGTTRNPRDHEDRIRVHFAVGMAF